MQALDEEQRIVLISVPNKDLASHIARSLVEQKLAACVNIIPGVKSIYRWEDKIQEDSELLLIVKTRATCYTALEESVVKMHPYDTPEIISLDISQGFAAYLNWITEETKA